MRSHGETHAKFAGTRADHEGKHASGSDHGDGESNRRESSKHNRIEPFGRQNFRPDILQRGGMLNGLLRGEVVPNTGDGRHDSVWIAVDPNEQSVAAFLVGRRIHGHHQGRIDLLIIDVDAASNTSNTVRARDVI